MWRSLTTALLEQLQRTLGDDYSVEEELTGGGMSRVFVAREARLHRRVVVKVLPPELAADISAERFEREIQFAARLQHPNIVIYAGQVCGLSYFIMPYMRGESLRQRMAAGPLPIVEAVKVLADVANALAYAQSEGVVHRDIKPDNILLTGGSAVVTDFGIAKALSASMTTTGGAAFTLTEAGTNPGTPAYMAPTQRRELPMADSRACLGIRGPSTVCEQARTASAARSADSEMWSSASTIQFGPCSHQR